MTLRLFFLSLGSVNLCEYTQWGKGDLLRGETSSLIL